MISNESKLTQYAEHSSFSYFYIFHNSLLIFNYSLFLTVKTLFGAENKKTGKLDECFSFIISTISDKKRWDEKLFQE